MQHKLNPEQGKPHQSFVVFWFPRCSVKYKRHFCLINLSSHLSFSPLSRTSRFGVSQTSAGSSRSSMENGGRERDRGSESDEDDDSQQNTSETGRLEERTVATYRTQPTVT